MELTTEQTRDIQNTINEFKQFNQDRLKTWTLKPIIGLMTVTTTNKPLGFGVRFYDGMFNEPEYLGQGLTFNPIQIIK